MYDKKYLYEFDPSGGLAANRVPGEPHIITPANSSDFDVIIPAFAPFFRKGLVVKHVNSGQTLTEGIHFDLGYHFVAASMACGTPLYAAIVLTDRTLSGQFLIDYQTLGGAWVMDTQEIETILANKKNDPREVKWDDIIEKPIVFPPVDHLHHSDDLVGMDDIRDKLEEIKGAIGEAAAKALVALLEHLRDHANPHQVTLAQLGLDSLGNLSEATELEVTEGTDGTHFISPRRLAFFLTSKVKALVDAHATLKNNPHGVTQTQVGLSDVPNYRMATLAEAMEGVLGNRFMSPSLVQALVKDRIASALADWGAGSEVTKESLGLDKVPNLPLAGFEDAVAGTSNEYLMSPLRTAQQVANAIATAINAHLQADNPHKITAKTVNLDLVSNFAIATAIDLTAGTATNKYVTVAGVTTMLKNYIDAGVGLALTNHINDKGNPHGVTKNQTGLGNVENYKPTTDSDFAIGNTTTYLTPGVLLRNLWIALSRQVMSVATVGDTVFAADNTTTGGASYGRMVSRNVVVATNADELAKLKAADENFGRVFNTWKRISLLTTNVSPAIVAETQSWSYDAATNSIKCTVNSDSLVGFVSPETYSDYVFEVRCKSSDVDDDMVGILLGCVVENGMTYTLIAGRTAGGTTATGNAGAKVQLFAVTTDYRTTSAKIVKSGNFGLKWADGVVDDTRNGNTSGKGWGDWLTGTKIRAVRAGNTITVTTTDLGSETYLPATQMVIDLTSTPELQRFMGRSAIGYVSMSQAAASWQVITRPDARTPILDLTTNQVLTYNGNTWVVAEFPEQIMPVGRLYHTSLTGKTHFVDTTNDVFLVADLNPVATITMASTPTIALSGDGTAANPLTASLTGNTPDTFHSDVDLTTGV